ncbi:MAG: hypothetical protein HYS69_14645 [candidate division NC10 bacterium]|nr:hypothetical protein [candidate division NC10 bacterium]
MAHPGTAADEFAVRYYRWSLEDCRREIREDFPLLRTVKSNLAIRALAYLESFPGDDRLRVATGLVRRCHRKALEITGESWTAHDEAIHQDYVRAARILRPEEEWYRQALLYDPGKWNQLTEADTPAAAQALGLICAHFLRAAPELVAGLSPAAG